MGADRACQVCRKLVCERCAADWARCEDPSGRILRLGFSARLRDVDPTGTLGLVSHWRRALRLFDLRRLCWIGGTDLPRRWGEAWKSCPPRVLSDGRMLYRHVIPALDDSYTHGLFLALPSGGERPCLREMQISHGSGVSAVGDLYWVVTQTQRVAVMRVAAADTSRWAMHEYEPLPNRVVQAAHVDGDRELLASASWGEVALDRMADGALHRVGYTKTERPGHIAWIAVAGARLAIVMQDMRVEVRRVAPDLAIREVVHRDAGVHAASLSRDGRFLALGTDRGLVVRELETGAESVLEGHRGRIDVVRFAGDDHVLVSGDTANRLILRPRHALGYDQPLIAIDVPDEPVALPAC